MISKIDWKMVEDLINGSFTNLTATERESMLERLKEISCNNNNVRVFCSYNGSHLAKIGLRYNISEKEKGTFYFVTEWYDELMDL